MKKEKSDYVIQTVIRALEVLEQFHDDVDELGVTELSKRLRLHKNNVFRLLATLESRNYVEQNKTTENYRLGLKNLELGQAVIKRMGLIDKSRPVLESLVQACNETAYVAIMRNSHVMYLDAVESEQAVRVVSRVGARLPAHCTAAGKVLLAAAIGTGRQLCSGMELRRHTSRTIVDRDEFLKELERVTAQGFALEDEELDTEVCGVAAPICDYTGSAVGALNVSGPIMRFSQERMHDELAPLVRKAAAEISRQLGYGFAAGAGKNG